MNHLKKVYKSIACGLSIIVLLFFLCSLFADDLLLEKYIASKGYSETISFDANNIKRFWIDNSVASKNGLIDITLNKTSKGFESIPLKIQLANVHEALNCKIDIVSKENNFNFIIVDEDNKLLSNSNDKEQFVDYTVNSASVPLEKTKNFSFSLIIFSKDKPILSINKIIISFARNPNSLFLYTPGEIKINLDQVYLSGVSKETTEIYNKNKKNNEFILCGKKSLTFFKKNIIVANNDIKTSVTIKNIGNESTYISVGFMVYNKDGIRLFARNYPYKKDSNSILHIVSAEKGSNVLITDSYPEWEKGCFLALNPKEDFSDIPNTNLLKNTIVSVKQLENGQGEINLDAPLESSLEKNSTIRVHGTSGSYLYTNTEILKPGMEVTYHSTIQKDNSFLEYSPKSFSRGVYYVKPIILSYSTEENIISISDYLISY